MVSILIGKGLATYLLHIVDLGVISGLLRRSLQKIMGHTKTSFQTLNESMGREGWRWYGVFIYLLIRKSSLVNSRSIAARIGISTIGSLHSIKRMTNGLQNCSTLMHNYLLKKRGTIIYVDSSLLLHKSAI